MLIVHDLFQKLEDSTIWEQDLFERLLETEEEIERLKKIFVRRKLKLTS